MLRLEESPPCLLVESLKRKLPETASIFAGATFEVASALSFGDGMIQFEKRKSLWLALSRSLVMPDEKWFDTMEAFLQELGSEEWNEGFSRTLREWTDAFQELKAEPLEEVQYEYTRLFVNGYPKTACPPYESVYREGTMLGELAMDVYLIYQDWGLEITREEAGDHLAVLLEFMYYLSSLLDVVEDDELRQAVEGEIRAFWKEHIESWLPKFVGDLVESAEMPFYTLLGNMLSETTSLMS